MTESTAPVVIRGDNYVNLLTGMGTSVDKSFYDGFCDRGRLTESQLDALYDQDAIAARVVDRLVDDGTREEFELSGEDESDFDFASVQSELEDLDARNQIADAWKWSRLYGGSVLFMNVMNSGKMDTPLDLSKATRLLSLQPITSNMLQPVGHKNGLGSRGFMAPEMYRVQTLNGESKTIHRSRVIRFDGVKVPPRRLLENNGWGPSVLDRIRDPLERLGVAEGNLATIMHDISIRVLKMEGLRKSLAGQGESTEADLRKVFESMKNTIDNEHMLVLDQLDSYEEVTRTVTGLGEMIDKFVNALVRATDMPRTILLGEQPGGLNANGDSEIRSWFDFVRAKQRAVLTPALSRILEVLFAIDEVKGIPAPTQFTIDYAPLWQPSEQEQATTRTTDAQGDDIYMISGVYSAQDVRRRLVSEGRLPSEALKEEPPQPAPTAEEISQLQGMGAPPVVNGES